MLRKYIAKDIHENDLHSLVVLVLKDEIGRKKMYVVVKINLKILYAKMPLFYGILDMFSLFNVIA